MRGAFPAPLQTCKCRIMTVPHHQMTLPHLRYYPETVARIRFRLAPPQSLPMHAERLTPARLALTVLYLILDDVDFDELLEHSGIPASRLDDMDGMLSFDDSCALIKSSLELNWRSRARPAHGPGNRHRNAETRAHLIPGNCASQKARDRHTARALFVKLTENQAG